MCKFKKPQAHQIMWKFRTASSLSHHQDSLRRQLNCWFKDTQAALRMSLRANGRKYLKHNTTTSNPSAYRQTKLSMAKLSQAGEEVLHQPTRWDYLICRNSPSRGASATRTEATLSTFHWRTTTPRLYSWEWASSLKASSPMRQVSLR